jgi:hypothetical protein
LQGTQFQIGFIRIVTGDVFQHRQVPVEVPNLILITGLGRGAGLRRRVGARLRFRLTRRVGFRLFRFAARRSSCA